MYITINDVIGEKRIGLSYPIKGRDGFAGLWTPPGSYGSMEITVVSMLSDNVQYWLQGSIEVLL